MVLDISVHKAQTDYVHLGICFTESTVPNPLKLENTNSNEQCEVFNLIKFCTQLVLLLVVYKLLNIF